jgi:hypothetical protein
MFTYLRSAEWLGTITLTDHNSGAVLSCGLCNVTRPNTNRAMFSRLLVVVNLRSKMQQCVYDFVFQFRLNHKP